MTTIKGIEDLLAKANNVTDFNEMFMNCPSLTSLDLSRWNTSKVTNLQEMFANDTNLQEVRGLGDWDASQVQNMLYTFQNCTNLTTLGSLANFAQASNLNNLIGTFMHTPKLTDQTTADSLANWNTSHVGSLVYTFLDNGFQKLDLSHWNTSNVGNFAFAFSQSAVKNLNLNGWDFSHGGVVSMFANLKNPALITMNDITLPTEANRFKVTDFTGNQPIVVISNQLPLSLNSEQLNANTIGRQNSNKLTFVEKGNPSHVLGTKPLDFVFASEADFQKAIAEATDKAGVDAAIGSNAAQWDPQSGYDLTDNPAVSDSTVSGKVLHTADITEPTAFPAIVAGTYQLTMSPVTEAYTQPISYRTADGREVGHTTINGTLSNGSATLAAADANNAIRSNLPSGYDYVSGLLTADRTITSSTNDPIIVTVRAQVVSEYTQPIIYRTADGQEVGRTSVTGTLIDGVGTLSAATANTAIDGNLPNHYDYVSGRLTADRTITSSTNDPIYVVVKAQTQTIDPGSNDATDDQFSTPTRTITVNDPDGTTHQIVQTVKFGRTKTINLATGDVQYGAWQLMNSSSDQGAQWDAYTAPTIAGYTADPASVAAQAVTPETGNQEVTINYVQNAAPGTPDQPVNPGNSDNPVTPSQPDNGQNNSGQGTVQPGGTPGEANNAVSHTAQQKLPQTGNEHSQVMSLLTIASLSLAGLLGLTEIKKKHE